MKQQIHNSQFLTHQAFFNSLLVETSIAHLDESNASPTGYSVTIPLENGEQLQLPLHYVSPSQRHRYTGQIRLMTSNGISDITLPAAIGKVLAHHFANIDAGRQDKFMQRISESMAYIQRAEDYRQAKQTTANAFIQSEQSLTGGHSMHPAPKSCEPLTIAEQQAYLPEFANEFAIAWFAVHKDSLCGDSTLADSLPTFLLDIWQNEFSGDPASLPSSEYLPMPMHPLQAKAWLASEQAAALGNKVQPLAHSSPGWTATSSSRAIYHPHSQWMLKLSLPVKLTNSLRLLTEAEANRGIQFSKLLQTPAGKELVQRLPETCFIEEPVWCGIQDDNGNSIALSVVCFRQNPFQQKEVASEQFQLLASANQVSNPQQDTQTGRWVKTAAEHQNLTTQAAAKQWVAKFMDTVIRPICIARSDYGIVLLAHQQNIMVRTHNGSPTGVALRDCQGMGLTDVALKRFESVFAQEEAGYFMSAQALNPFQAYYVIGNTLLNTLAAIAADCQVSETELWQICRDKFDQYRHSHPQDSSFYDYILQSTTLRWKRNFLCFLADFNEATLADLSQIYCETTNPIHYESTQETERERIYKQLPDGRELQFTTLEASDYRVSFAVKVIGSESNPIVFNGLLDNNKSNAALTYIRSAALPSNLDSLIWFSAIEHVHFSLNATQVIAEQLNQTEVNSITAHLPAQITALATPNTVTVARKALLEHAPLWLRKAQQLADMPRITAENGCTHPQRPAKPTGVLYERYFYHLQRTITIRVIDNERDLACFSEWHNVPETHDIWELAGTKSEHQAYLQAMHDANYKFSVIGEYDGVPFGYFELYWAAEDRLGPYYEHQDYDRGVHILVGNLNYRGGRYFEAWAKAVLQFIYQDDPRTNNVMGEPRADNHRVIAVTGKVGMEKQFEFDFPHKRAALLQCKRARYFEQFAI